MADSNTKQPIVDINDTTPTDERLDCYLNDYPNKI